MLKVRKAFRVFTGGDAAEAESLGYSGNGAQDASKERR